MSDTNRISEPLSTEGVATILADIESIRAKLPFLLSLTPEVRRSLPKLGDSRVALDEDGSKPLVQHPQFVPSFVDAAEVAKDRALRTSLDSIRLSLETLHDDVESTQMVVRSELYNAYLASTPTLRRVPKQASPQRRPW